MIQPPFSWEYDTKQFREAATKKELCDVKKNSRNENLTLAKNFKDYCKNSVSNGIYICPKENLKLIDNERIQRLNKDFSKHKCCKAKSKRRAKSRSLKRRKKKKKKGKKKRNRRRKKPKKKCKSKNYCRCNTC